jgi:chemotaxis protein methyltransferase CheR
MVPALTAPALGRGEFDAIRGLLHEVCGIRLNPGKEELVRSRLLRRLRDLNVGSFGEYVTRLRGPGGKEEAQRLVDLLTTNTTSFFREKHHFDLLRTQLIPEWQASRAPVRIWSAGCSSGQEPYTIAMTLFEASQRPEQWDVRILATDISSRILATAKRGVYEKELTDSIPGHITAKYFEPAPEGSRVVDKLRKKITFAPLNLMTRWPMRGPFQAIFCRNVMIYFERDLQAKLAARFIELLAPGGYLFLGHSEALAAGRSEMSPVAPSAYRRAA